MTRTPRLRAFLIFGSVGLVAAVFHYGTLIALCELFAVHPVPASVAGFLAGGAVSYLLNYRFTFMSERRHLVAVPLFFLVALAGLALNTLSMALLVEGLGVQYVLAQLATTGLVLFWHFFANARWTFAAGGAS